MYSAKLGPSGGERGYEGVFGVGSPGYSWYIQGFITPDLYMQRGITYSFKVEGGNNPHHTETYHPFIITNEVRINDPIVNLSSPIPSSS